MENIEKRVVALQEEVNHYKTSQLLGQSNTVVYHTVTNYTWTVTAQYYANMTITFTSDEGVFPLTKTLVDYSGTGSASVRLQYANAQTAPSLNPNQKAMYISVDNLAGTSRTMTFTLNIWATQKGSVSVTTTSN